MPEGSRRDRHDHRLRPRHGLRVPARRRRQGHSGTPRPGPAEPRRPPLPGERHPGPGARALPAQPCPRHPGRRLRTVAAGGPQSRGTARHERLRAAQRVAGPRPVPQEHGRGGDDGRLRDHPRRALGHAHLPPPRAPPRPLRDAGGLPPDRRRARAAARDDRGDRARRRGRAAAVGARGAAGGARRVRHDRGRAPPARGRPPPADRVRRRGCLLRRPRDDIGAHPGRRGVPRPRGLGAAPGRRQAVFDRPARPRVPVGLRLRGGRERALGDHRDPRRPGRGDLVPFRVRPRDRVGRQPPREGGARSGRAADAARLSRPGARR